ncbi:MAG: hypothetical protein PHG35_00940 [Dehalococcoidales bacterium]|nr:hypothetical protein [Dehalococcoidales bacterium]
MEWFNKHLNLTYVIFFAVSIAASAIILSKGLSLTYVVIASVVSLLINLVAGGWVLWKKGQSLWWLMLLLFMTIAFVIFVLILPNRNKNPVEKDAVTDEDYYQKRGKK